MEADDELLLEFTRTRSEQAFRRLVERFGGIVHSICYRRLRDPHLAEDAAQMVFATLARKATVVEPGLVGPWLYQTANFISHGVARRRDRRRKLEHRIAAERPESYASSDPAMTAELIDQHLLQLDENSRNALVLRYVQEKSLPEIAIALQITPEATKKRLARGVKRLRKLMADSGVFATVMLTESALHSIRGQAAPMGFVDRVIGKLGAEGLFANPDKPTPLRHPFKVPLTVGATVSVSLAGMLAIWWVNKPAAIVHPPVAATVPQIVAPTADQRLRKKFAPFDNQSDFLMATSMLTERTGEKIDVLWDVVRTKGIEPSTPATAYFNDPTLKQGLDRLLSLVSSKPSELRYVVEPNRIVITLNSSNSVTKQSNQNK